MSAPQGGRVSITVDESSVTCSICTGITRAPYHLACMCRSSFCGSCLTEWLEKNSRCPLCNVKATDMIADSLDFEHISNGIKRPCSNSTSCRERKRSFDGIQVHEERDCKYRTITCPNLDCEERVMARDLSTHLKSCPLQRCKHYVGTTNGVVYGCSVIGTTAEVDRHTNRIGCKYNNSYCLDQLRLLYSQHSK